MGFPRSGRSPSWGGCRLLGASRGLQDGPRRVQDGPRRVQDGPRRVQDGPKTLQDAAKTAKTLPRRLLDGPKTPRDPPNLENPASEAAPRPLREAISSRRGGRNQRFSLGFCTFLRMRALGLSLGRLGPSWGVLGPSWGCLRGVLGAALGPSWGRLGPSRGRLRAVLRPSWAFVGRPGAVLGVFWFLLEQSLGRSGWNLWE